MVVSPIIADEPSTIWSELRDVDERWLEGRTLRREVRRATRRAVLAPERHTTKLVARTADGRAVGWACLDHVYCSGRVVGVGLAVLRSDPRVPGVSTLLAVEGARHCAEEFPEGQLTFLDLGLSPLAPVPDGVEWNPMRTCAEVDECVVEPPRAPLVDALFASLFRWGTGLYNTRGLAGWKRKWRPDEGLAYVGVRSALPARELAATLVLLAR